MNEPEVICEKVTIDAGTDNEVSYLVQYEHNLDGLVEKSDCLRHLCNCGHTVMYKSHDVVTAGTKEDGTEDDPAMSWADLSDVVEPADR